MTDQHIDIVFTGPPGPEPGTCGFIEVERADGRSVAAGTWLQRPDGTWALRITAADIDRIAGASG